jgi:hypothetical protein
MLPRPDNEKAIECKNMEEIEFISSKVNKDTVDVVETVMEEEDEPVAEGN